MEDPKCAEEWVIFKMSKGSLFGLFRTFDTAGEFIVSGKWHHESDERRPARLGQRCPRQPVTQPNKVQGRCGHDMLQVGFC
jgi:hypothetical protein